MCWYITLGVGAAWAEAVESFVPKISIRIDESNEIAAARLCPPGSTVYTVTSQGCSCNFFTGTRQRNASDDEALRTKFKRKGWTAAKIERAVAESGAATDRNDQKSAEELGELLGVLNQLIDHVARAGAIVFLHRHMYSGSLVTEILPPTAASSMMVEEWMGSDFPADTLLALRPIR